MDVEGGLYGLGAGGMADSEDRFGKCLAPQVRQSLLKVTSRLCGPISKMTNSLMLSDRTFSAVSVRWMMRSAISH